MQQVVIIPAAEWNSFQANQIALEKRLERIERSQVSWLGTKEASRLTGLSRTALDGRRDTNGGAWAYGTDWKKEGAKVLYSRLALEAWNDSHKPRRRSLN